MPKIEREAAAIGTSRWAPLHGQPDAVAQKSGWKSPEQRFHPSFIKTIFPAKDAFQISKQRKALIVYSRRPNCVRRAAPNEAPSISLLIFGVAAVLYETCLNHHCYLSQCCSKSLFKRSSALPAASSLLPNNTGFYQRERKHCRLQYHICQLFDAAWLH